MQGWELPVSFEHLSAVEAEEFTAVDKVEIPGTVDRKHCIFTKASGLNL